MTNNIEYFVTKLSFRERGDLINDVFAYSYDGIALSEGEVRQRQWLVNRTELKLQISIMTRNEEGKWIRGNVFTYNNNLYTWGSKLPENIPRRKVFISYYHNDDQDYRERFENLFGDLVVSKSVEAGDLDSDNSADYIKQLIQQEYLLYTTVLIVLIGANTRCRKHVDWEISGALNYKVGDKYAGVIGLFLPSHPNYGSDKYTPDLVPRRLSANFKTSYAIARDWTDDRAIMQEYIEKAFNKRSESEKIVNLTIPQMQRNTGE
ncbi:MAG: TIR domain-containing protein [Syntrophaceae bacterium]|nr:TIR domain-containing protein [Syntrophaceae bacterium]